MSERVSERERESVCVRVTSSSNLILNDVTIEHTALRCSCAQHSCEAESEWPDRTVAHPGRQDGRDHFIGDDGYFKSPIGECDG